MAFNYFVFTRFQKIILLLVFAGSFLIGPFQSLKNGKNSGKQAYEIAEILKTNKITGKVIGNYINNDQYTEILMSNIIAKNQFYNFSRGDFSTAQLTEAINKADIDYYIHSYTTQSQKEVFISGDMYKKSIHAFPDIYPGIIIIKLK